jgi:hypothetical protein
MTISSTTRKAGPYIGNGTASVFPFAFKVFQASDVEVVRLTVATNVETTLALTTDYTVSLNQDQDSNPGGSITLVAGALATGYNLVITSDVENLQPTDLTNQGGFYPDVINDALDRATIQIQQLQEGLDRAALLPITSSADAASLVADIVRLADSADNLDIDANNIGSINTVATNIANVNTTASNIASVNTAAGSIANINTTAANITNVNAVGSDLLEPVSEINTVAVNIANVNTVGDNIASVNTVAGNNSNVTTVAGSISNVNTVGASITNVNTTAANIANVNAVGSDLLEPVSEINTVATDIANVNTVGNNISNVNTVAGISGNVTTVAGISSNVTTVATNNANVTTVATNIANVNAVAGNNSNITAVAGNATNINAVAGNVTNINAVNANSANINTVAGSNTAINTVSTNIVAVNSAYTNLAAIIDAPNQAAAAANSAAQAAASAASGMYSAVQDKSANYTIVAADAGDLIRVTTTSGAVTITLPLIGSTGITDGFKIAIVKWTSDANAVNIARSGSNTINGATSAQIGSQYSQIILVADAETSTWFASQSGLGATNINVDTFSGNGSTTAFTLTSDPSTKNNTSVFISGVYKQKSTYSLSGTTLTFSTAPPSGTANIEVAYSTPLAIGTPSDGTVTAAKMAAGAAVGNIGYTPVNKAGDTLSGVFDFGSSMANIPKIIKTYNSGTYQAGIGMDPSSAALRLYAPSNDPAIIIGHISNSDGVTFTERLRIDNGGRLTMPYQPAFSAAGSGATPNTVGAVLQYSTALLNVGGHYNTSTYRFTAPVSGNYRFSFNCIFNASTYLFASLYKNGAYLSGAGSIGIKQGAGVECQSSCTIVLPANANDFFDVRIWYYSSGYVGLYADHANFSGELIG